MKGMAIMMGKIKVLDKITASQIAAGEVVERPVSVVKELVENSLDANSSSIDIRLKKGGLDEIRVIDDGDGMSAEELPLAFKRHATSKISVFQDLCRLQTLGFRGEALPSISSVSLLEITSQEEDTLAGNCLAVEGGEIRELKEVGSSRGTDIRVKNLFSNVPGRLKFIKSSSQEASKINTLVTRLAMAYPEIAFSLTVEGRKTFTSAGNGDLLGVIASVYGLKAINSFVAYSYEDGGFFQAAGRLSKPDYSRSSRAQQTFFINKRYIQSSLLNQALEEAYHTLLPKGRYPLCVVNLSIDPSLVDVNVHPAKRQVRFSSEKEIFQELRDSFKKTLNEADLIPRTILPVKYVYGNEEQAKKVAEKRVGGAETVEKAREQDSFWGKISEAVDSADSIKATEIRAGSDFSGANANVHSKTKVANEGDAATTESIAGEVSIKKKDSLAAEVNEGSEQRQEYDLSTYERQEALTQEKHWQEGSSRENAVAEKGTEKRMSSAVNTVNTVSTVSTIGRNILIGQLADTYILYQDTEENLVVIDQHTAHERILYEKIKQEAESAQPFWQQILPDVLEVDSDLADLLQERLPEFNAAGLCLEEFGERSFVLRAVPIFLKTNYTTRLIQDMLEEILREDDSASEKDFKEKIYQIMACKAAVKAGKKLTRLEMEQVIAGANNLTQITCPHGRPVQIIIGKKEIAKNFLRNK